MILKQRLTYQQKKSLIFILSEFINTHSGYDSQIYKDDIRIAKLILDKLEFK